MKRIMMIVLVCGLTSACQERQAPPPTPPAPKTVTLFNGKDLTGWKPIGYVQFSKWAVGTPSVDPADAKKLVSGEGEPALVSIGGMADLQSDQTFGDGRIELQIMLPTESNSGVFVLGQYELQLENHPPKDRASPGDMDIGAIARVSAPLVYVEATPGQWHTVSIDYQAAKFDAAGKKTANAKFVEVRIDSHVVQNNVEVPEPTAGAPISEEQATGPIVLQGSEGHVAFKAVTFTPAK